MALRDMQVFGKRTRYILFYLRINQVFKQMHAKTSKRHFLDLPLGAVT